MKMIKTRLREAARLNVLITGISGFTGRHLYEYLLTIPNLKLYGLSRSVTRDLKNSLPHASLTQGDILGYEALRELMERINPNYVFHLAGQRPGAGLWAEQRDAFITNCIGTMTLLEAIKSTGCSARVLIPSSSAVYGVVDTHKIPISEEQTICPVDAYGVSKAAQEIICRQYFVTQEIKIMIARTFNCIGPGQRKEFVCSSFAHQLVQVKKGYRKPNIEVGNLKPVRDYIDVRDVVRAYWLIMDQGMPGQVYNICSRKGHSVKEVLDILIEKADISVQIVEKAARIRSADIPISVGSYAKLHKQTGWNSEVKIDDTLWEMLDFWDQQSSMPNE